MTVILHLDDIRVHDNPVINEAANQEELIPLYVWDESWLDPYGEHYKTELKQGLQRLNHAYHTRGTHLTVLHNTTFEAVIQRFDQPIYVTLGVFEGDRQRRYEELLDHDHVHPVRDEPIRAETNETSQQKIAAYLNAQQRRPPTTLPSNPLPDNIQQTDKEPRQTLDLTVFNHHAEDYLSIVSNPLESRTKTTRTSHYLATGQLSLRHVYQAIRDEHDDHPVLNRIRWNLRFLHKLANYPDLNTSPINPYFEEHLPYEANNERIHRWKNGETGHPLVDASMRCLNQTGYLNFRMRALLASYFTHILRQPWWIGAAYMHKQLIDAEPHINHYQWQMQSHMIGSHPLRIYNPTKQAKDHDENAAFIKQWVPELNDLEASQAIKPWHATEAYPEPKPYAEASEQTRQWFADRTKQITEALSDEGNKPLLSQASQKRLRERREKYSSADLTDF